MASSPADGIDHPACGTINRMRPSIARLALLVASLVGLGSAVIAVVVITSQVSGCCGGPPSGQCEFVEVIDAAADATLICGGEICVPGVSTCCFEQAGPVIMCRPIGAPCNGQVSVCDGDEDCMSGLHCCGVAKAMQITCQALCPGDESSGTVRICHQDSECPVELPYCTRVDYQGRLTQICAATR